MDELEKLLKKLEKALGKEPEKKAEAIKKAKKTIKQVIEDETIDLEAIIFCTNYGCVTTGTGGEILSLISTMFNNLKDNLPIDILTYSFLLGVACKEPENSDKLDLDIVNEILNEIKNHI